MKRGRRLPDPRSLRVSLFLLGLGLVALPLVLLGVAWTYEQGVVAQQYRHLQAAANEAVLAKDLDGVARKAHVMIARLDTTGTEMARAGIAADALRHSALGWIGERLVGAEHSESLDEADRSAGPWTERAEVRGALAGIPSNATHVSTSGQTVVLSHAQPLPSGGALYLLSGSHRGVRRLVLLRNQFLQLCLYELVLAAPVLIFFALRIVRPLERLAYAARHYPAVPLADPRLLSRHDEISTLARTLAGMAEDLDRRRKQAADLGADIAHEFKNPLAAISAAAELLATTKTPNPERLKLVADTVAQSAERLRRSVDDLLALLRLEQTVAGEARDSVMYASLVDDLVAEYQRAPHHLDWCFRPDVDATVGELRLNRRRWSELLRNLVDNALVQPASRKEIVIGAQRLGDEVRTFVRDHGPGISPENQKKIFDRFFTQRPAGVPAGAGLGLSVVQAIAIAHQGRIEVQSQPGQGAEFRVVLPG
jgi:signal transduction histidine kinase